MASSSSTAPPPSTKITVQGPPSSASLNPIGENEQLSDRQMKNGIAPVKTQMDLYGGAKVPVREDSRLPSKTLQSSDSVGRYTSQDTSASGSKSNLGGSSYGGSSATGWGGKHTSPRNIKLQNKWQESVQKSQQDKLGKEISGWSHQKSRTGSQWNLSPIWSGKKKPGKLNQQWFQKFGTVAPPSSRPSRWAGVSPPHSSSKQKQMQKPQTWNMSEFDSDMLIDELIADKTMPKERQWTRKFVRSWSQKGKNEWGIDYWSPFGSVDGDWWEWSWWEDQGQYPMSRFNWEFPWPDFEVWALRSFSWINKDDDEFSVFDFELQALWDWQWGLLWNTESERRIMWDWEALEGGNGNLTPRSQEQDKKQDGSSWSWTVEIRGMEIVNRNWEVGVAYYDEWYQYYENSNSNKQSWQNWNWWGWDSSNETENENDNQSMSTLEMEKVVSVRTAIQVEDHKDVLSLQPGAAKFITGKTIERLQKSLWKNYEWMEKVKQEAAAWEWERLARSEAAELALREELEAVNQEHQSTGCCGKRKKKPPKDGVAKQKGKKAKRK